MKKPFLFTVPLMKQQKNMCMKKPFLLTVYICVKNNLIFTICRMGDFPELEILGTCILFRTNFCITQNTFTPIKFLEFKIFCVKYKQSTTSLPSTNVVSLTCTLVHGCILISTAISLLRKVILEENNRF